MKFSSSYKQDSSAGNRPEFNLIRYYVCPVRSARAVRLGIVRPVSRRFY